MFEGNFTTIGVRWHLHPRVVKGSLNARLCTKSLSSFFQGDNLTKKHVGDIMPAVDDEIHYAFNHILPSSHGALSIGEVCPIHS